MNWLTATPDPLTYQNSKLKRYFKIVKYMMEDTILSTAKNSFEKLKNFVFSFIPSKV